MDYINEYYIKPFDTFNFFLVLGNFDNFIESEIDEISPFFPVTAW